MYNMMENPLPLAGEKQFQLTVTTPDSGLIVFILLGISLFRSPLSERLEQANWGFPERMATVESCGTFLGQMTNVGIF